MGNSNVVLYQRTPLFRTLSKHIEARPQNRDGQPLPVLAAFCMAYTGLDKLNAVFIRPVEAWQPPQTGALKVLVRSFVQHTLVRYPMPEFMYKVWDSDNVLHQQWFIHLGAGRNLCKAEGLPFVQPITKMHAHYFCAAPSWMQVGQALRYGQVLSMGGPVRLAKAVATSRIGTVLDTASDAFIFAFKNVKSPFSASLLTVEVRQNRQIIQVKGPANRQPTPNERQVVRTWAQLAGLNPDCWDMREE